MKRASELVQNSNNRGWRTQASLGRSGPVQDRALGAADVAAPRPAVAGRTWRRAFAGRVATGTTHDTSVPQQLGGEQLRPWQGVQWTLLLVAFLAYVWITTTLRFSGAYIAVAVAAVGLLMQSEPLRVPRFVLLFGGLLLWGAVGLTYTAYPDHSIEALDAAARVWVVALLAANALRTRQQLRLFIFVFLAAYALYPVRGALLNYFVGGHTLVGRAIWNQTYENPNDLAAITLPALGMVAALLVREPRGWTRLVAYAGALVLPLLILLTQSRGGILALGTAVLLGVAAQRGRRNKAFALLAVLAGVISLAAPGAVWNRLSQLTKVVESETMREVDAEGSAEGRWATWKVAVALWRDRPVVGVGFGTYPQAHARQAATMDVPLSATGERDTHSTYLNVLAESGVVGLGLFLAMLASVLLYAERVRRALAKSRPVSARELLYLELGVVAFLLAGVFGTFTKIAFTYLFLAVLWSATRLAEAELESATASRGRV